MLSPGHHPLPGARRPADAARGVRRARGPRARLRRRRQQRRALAGDRRRAGRASRCASRRPPASSSRTAHGAVLTDDPAEAVAGADAVYTDVWVSMGDDEPTRGSAARRSRPTGSTTRCSTAPRPDAIALHCLPAHPGEEITEEVLYGDRQRIWDQAENRRHAQKALLELLVGSGVRTTMPTKRRQPSRKKAPASALPAARSASRRMQRPARAAPALPRPARGRRAHARPPAGGARRRRRARPHDARRRRREPRWPTLVRSAAAAQTDDLTARSSRRVVSRRRPTRMRARGRPRPPRDRLGSSFPITGYDDLTAAQVSERLDDLTPRRSCARCATTSAATRTASRCCSDRAQARLSACHPRRGVATSTGPPPSRAPTAATSSS